jgi:pSer/pThr/pTyr-binding forkhead associated (FHA) protein
MTDLSFVIARIAVVVAIWLFIFLCIALIRRDVFGSHLNPRKNRSSRDDQRPTSLRVVSGQLTGTVIPLSGVDILIGREPGSSLTFSDDFVSAKHARIFTNQKVWFIEDLQSTNGTFVNSKKISKVTELAVGDKIKIGRSTMRVEK